MSHVSEAAQRSPEACEVASPSVTAVPVSPWRHDTPEDHTGDHEATVASGCR